MRVVPFAEDLPSEVLGQISQGPASSDDVFEPADAAVEGWGVSVVMLEGYQGGLIVITDLDGGDGCIREALVSGGPVAGEGEGVARGACGGAVGLGAGG